MATAVSVVWSTMPQSQRRSSDVGVGYWVGLGGAVVQHPALGGRLLFSSDSGLPGQRSTIVATGLFIFVHPTSQRGDLDVYCLLDQPFAHQCRCMSNLNSVLLHSVSILPSMFSHWWSLKLSQSAGWLMFLNPCVDTFTSLSNAEVSTEASNLVYYSTSVFW